MRSGLATGAGNQSASAARRGEATPRNAVPRHGSPKFRPVQHLSITFRPAATTAERDHLLHYLQAQSSVQRVEALDPDSIHPDIRRIVIVALLPGHSCDRLAAKISAFPVVESVQIPPSSVP